MIHRDHIDLDHIPSHPDVEAALQALKPHGVRYVTLLRQALSLIHDLDIASLTDETRQGDADRALFALVEEKAKAKEDQEDTWGALEIISQDTSMSFRQVLRRHDRMECRVATAFLVLLVHNLQWYGMHDHAEKVHLILDELLERE